MDRCFLSHVGTFLQRNQRDKSYVQVTLLWAPKGLYFSLHWNELGPEGDKVIGEALKMNQTVVDKRASPTSQPHGCAR